MIMEVETTFCKMYEQFQAIVMKLERAVEENRPIHQFEGELVEDLRTLGGRNVHRAARGRRRGSGRRA
jgi:hypothetical protein